MKTVYHDNLKNLSKAIKSNKGTNHVQPSFLREAQLLPEKGGAVTFTFKETQAVADETDVRLTQNDIFRATHVGVFLSKTNPSFSTAGLKISQLFTYPNATEFPIESGTGAQITNANFLESIYNGKLEMKFGEKTNVESMPMMLFRKVPQTQKTSSTNRDMFDFLEGMYELPTPLNIHGKMTMEFTLKIPTATGVFTQYGITDTNGKIYAVLVLFGGRVKDGVTWLEDSSTGGKDDKWKSVISA